MEPVAKRRGRPRKVDESPKEDATISTRHPMRAEMRDSDPRASAAKRAQEILGNIGGADEGQDSFRTPPAPDGWTYEWKRNTLVNQEDPAYMTSLIRTGWEPVPAKRHPEMMPIGATKSIERKGMILMERPAEVTRQFEEADKRRANDWRGAGPLGTEGKSQQQIGHTCRQALDHGDPGGINQRHFASQIVIDSPGNARRQHRQRRPRVGKSERIVRGPGKHNRARRNSEHAKGDARIEVFPENKPGEQRREYRLGVEQQRGARGWHLCQTLHQQHRPQHAP